MPNSPKKHDPNQYRLPFGQPPEAATRLRSIDYRTTGLTEHRWRQVREVLIAVAYCGLRNGCSARRETLLAKANEHRDAQCEPLVSMRTFERRHNEAVEMGLLVVERRYKRTANRALAMDKINSLVKQTRELYANPETPTCAVESGGSSGGLVADRWRISGGSSGGSKTNKTNINSNKLLLTKNNWSTGDQKNQSLDWERAYRDAKVIARKIGRPKNLADRSLLIKAAALSQSLSEHWLNDAVEGVVQCQPANAYAYLHRVLSEGCPMLNRHLARLDVPDGILTTKHEVDLGQRLCVAEEI